MPFDYFEQLSRKQQRTYRRSDDVPRIELPDAASLGPLLERVRIALEADHRARLGEATHALADAILDRLAVPRVTVLVLARRPSSPEAELHGLYVREEDGSAVIRLWMRTAAHAQPVRFRTYVRTFAHELLHHLDFEVLQLEDTFHTEGFFRRESDLVKQLLGEARQPSGRKPARKDDDEDPAQLSLFK